MLAYLFNGGLGAQAKFSDAQRRFARTEEHDECLTVLRKRVALDHLDVAPAILEFLADRVTSNLRGLEAALVRAVAFASLAQEPLTIELATRVLHDLGPAATTTIGRHAPSVEDVQDATIEPQLSFALWRCFFRSVRRLKAQA